MIQIITTNESTTHAQVDFSSCQLEILLTLLQQAEGKLARALRDKLTAAHCMLEACEQVPLDSRTDAEVLEDAIRESDNW